MSGKYCQFCQIRVADGDPEQVVYLGEPSHRHCLKRSQQQQRDEQQAQEERQRRQQHRLVIALHQMPTAYQ